MSPATTTIPKSHSITVNLNHILTTLQRAIETTSYYHTYPARPFEVAPPTELSSCQVTTMEELRAVLKPALTHLSHTYFKRWHEGQPVHILRYVTPAAEKRHVILYPTQLFIEETDTECSIDQSLAYYLGLALDPVAQPVAINHEDARMIGALRCFGNGRHTCSNFETFMPPVPETYRYRNALPLYSLWYDSFKYAFTDPISVQTSSHLKLKLLYLSRAARGALALAESVQHIHDDNATIAKPVSDLIQQFTPEFRTKTSYEFEDTYLSQIERLNAAIPQFLEALFKTEAWQLSYRHFRNYFFNIGCEETIDEEKNTYNIDCSQYGRRFSARVPSHNQITAEAPKVF